MATTRPEAAPIIVIPGCDSFLLDESDDDRSDTEGFIIFGAQRTLRGRKDYRDMPIIEQPTSPTSRSSSRYSSDSLRSSSNDTMCAPRTSSEDARRSRELGYPVPELVSNRFSFQSMPDQTDDSEASFYGLEDVTYLEMKRYGTVGLPPFSLVDDERWGAEMSANLPFLNKTPGSSTAGSALSRHDSLSPSVRSIEEDLLARNPSKIGPYTQEPRISSESGSSACQPSLPLKEEKSSHSRSRADSDARRLQLFITDAQRELGGEPSGEDSPMPLALKEQQRENHGELDTVLRPMSPGQWLMSSQIEAPRAGLASIPTRHSSLRRCASSPKKSQPRLTLETNAKRMGQVHVLHAGKTSVDSAPIMDIARTRPVHPAFKKPQLNSSSHTNSRPHSLERSLHNAIYNGDLEKAQQLLRMGVNPDLVHTDQGILAAAAMWGHTAVGKIMSQHALDRSRSNCETCTMKYTDFSRDANIVLSLLKHGLDPQARGGLCGCPLNTAAWMGRLDLVTILLDHGADLGQTAGKYRTALCSAAAEAGYAGNLEVVKLLIHLGVDVFASSPYGNARMLALKRRDFWRNKLAERSLPVASTKIRIADCGYMAQFLMETETAVRHIAFGQASNSKKERKGFWSPLLRRLSLKA